MYREPLASQRKGIRKPVSKNQNPHFILCFGFMVFIEPITSILMQIIINLTSQQEENEIFM